MDISQVVPSVGPAGERIGQLGCYKIIHNSMIKLATVQVPGLLNPKVLCVRQGDDAYEQCLSWLEQHDDDG